MAPKRHPHPASSSGKKPLCTVTTPCLMLVIVAQWTLLLFLCHYYQTHELSQTTYTTDSKSLSSPAARNPVAASIFSHDPEGVAVTLLHQYPKWFHLRFTSMIHNALVNIPTTWKVQIFYNPKWFEENILPWHPTLRRWFKQGHDRIVFTPVPDEILKPNGKIKSVRPKNIVATRWFWNTVLADKVLMFSGNGAFCGNHFYREGKKSIDIFDDSFMKLDFMGTPSGINNGFGGDASSHSFRKKKAMLHILSYAEKHNITLGKLNEHKWIFEVVESMQAANVKPKLKLATPQQTMAFGGVQNLTDKDGVAHIPFVVAGTQARLSFEERDLLLNHCVEVKTIFPTLHEPTCFGAHPNPQKCKESICALQDKIPAQGC